MKAAEEVGGFRNKQISLRPCIGFRQSLNKLSYLPNCHFGSFESLHWSRCEIHVNNVIIEDVTKTHMS